MDDAMADGVVSIKGGGNPVSGALSDARHPASRREVEQDDVADLFAAGEGEEFAVAGPAVTIEFLFGQTGKPLRRAAGAALSPDAVGPIPVIKGFAVLCPTDAVAEIGRPRQGKHA